MITQEDGTQAILQTSNDILAAYQRQNITMTLRQLYYQLVARDMIPNVVSMYKKLSELLTDARYAGFLDWDHLTDLTRSSERASQWGSVADIMDTAASSYRRPRWEGQPYHVELLTEKEALFSVLDPIAREWHIFLTVNRGFGSASLAYQMAWRLQEEIQQEKQAVILYIGDHDPSGLAMVGDMRSRLSEFLKFRHVPLSAFTFRALALTTEQVRQYNPPENPAKETDSRFKAYQKAFGDVSWEVDALQPETMRGIIDKAILEYVDLSEFERVKEREAAEKQELRTIAARYRKEGGQPE